MRLHDFDEIHVTDVVIVLASLSVIWCSIGYIAGKFLF